MTNSPLVQYTHYSPYHSGKRNHKIDTITIHCMAANLTVESCGNWFSNPAAQASSNYGIDSTGKIALYVDEQNRSWATSSASNDHRAVTIEVANTLPQAPYPISDAAYQALIRLLVDICQRNEIQKLLWQADKNQIGQTNKQNMTVHRWFANRSCPGDYLYNLHAQIANDVNQKLQTNQIEKEEQQMRYNTLEEIPDWGKPTVQKLLDNDLLAGNGQSLDLSLDMLRILVILDRSGEFDKKEYLS